MPKFDCDSHYFEVLFSSDEKNKLQEKYPFLCASRAAVSKTRNGASLSIMDRKSKAYIRMACRDMLRGLPAQIMQHHLDKKTLEAKHEHDDAHYIAYFRQQWHRVHDEIREYKISSVLRLIR